MKANLEFNLPEERSDLVMAEHGHDFWNTLWDISNLVRKELDENESQVLERIQNMIWDTNGFNEVE